MTDAGAERCLIDGSLSAIGGEFRARRLSVRRGLARLGYKDETLADHIADAFTELRRAEYRLYPDAHATVDALRQRGVKLALVTNGSAEFQRADSFTA